MKNKPNTPEATTPYTSNQQKQSHERGGDKKSTGGPYTSSQNSSEASLTHTFSLTEKLPFTIDTLEIQTKQIDKETKI